MRKFIKASLLIAILCMTSCSASKHVAPTEHRPTRYRVPECHKELHQKLLQEQGMRLKYSDNGTL